MPRRRRFRITLTHRFLLWIILPAALLVSVRLIWGWHSNHRLAALRQRLHDQGFPVNLTDFPDLNSVPSADNAATAVRETLTAMQSRYPTPAMESLRRDRSGRTALTRTPAEILNLRELAESHRPALEKLDEAARRPHVIWPRPGGTGTVDTYRAANLCRLLCNLALVAHGDHDDAQALHQVWRALVFSEILAMGPDRDARYRLDQHGRVVMELLESLIPELDLRSPAAEAEAQAVLHALLRDTPRQFAASVSHVLLVESLALSIARNDRSNWLLPLEQDRRIRDAEILAAESAWIQAPNFQRAQATISTSPYGWNRLESLVRPDRGHSFDQLFEQLAWRRAVALLLAARLHQARHGAPPADPARLVPDILPAIPLDPYADPDQPLRYRLDADDPTVWSVGRDGRDDTSTGKRGDDRIFGAARFPPAPAPAPAPPPAPLIPPSSVPLE